jgi:NAD(P)-dependent dehydrogenase (short-subunit alcohol dehydrogenase family)|tara:strand:- start:904 stop:1674 length:771 start_codon:yes stop_codon:yes gene_type:complete
MSNQHALILGVSSGIGRACAIALASKGLNIIGLYMRKPRDVINNLEDEIKTHNVEANLIKMNACNYEAMDTLLSGDKFQNIQIKTFIHSLAFGSMKPFISKDVNTRLNKKNIDMTLDVMSNSLIYWTQALYQNNLFIKGSQIIGMTSSGGRRQWDSYGAVSMSKAALESASRQLAIELAKDNIGVNTIQAGVTDTPALRKIPGNEDMIERTLAINPSKRLTLPNDIAQVVSLIGLSDSTWMTGNVIRVDGGEDIVG